MAPLALPLLPDLARKTSAGLLCPAGFLQGVGTGIVIAILLFVVNYSRIDIVKDSFNGETYRSRTERPIEHRQLIKELVGNMSNYGLPEPDHETVLRLAQVPGIFGIKEATGSIERGKTANGEDYEFYDITTDGFSLDDRRTPIEANDIPDVLAKWPKREEGPNSYRVPIEKIRENDWSLAAGRYKPVTTAAVNHDAPAEILNSVLKLENEIIRRGNGLLAQDRRG